MDKPLAGVGQRFTAQFIDGLVAVAFGAAFYYAAQLLSLPLEFWVIGYVLYLLFCDAMPSGQSLGKKLTKIAVVHNVSNAPCTYLQSFVRNSSLLILSILDAIFILGKSKRRLGDYLASTKVVRL
jgi:uncharacterized RDD family membrane protein YckC